MDEKKKSFDVVIGCHSRLGIEIINLEKKKPNPNIIGVGRSDATSNQERVNLYLKCDLTKRKDVKALIKNLKEFNICKIYCIAGAYLEGENRKTDNEMKKLIYSHSIAYTLILEKLIKKKTRTSVIYISSTSVYWKGNNSISYSAAKTHAEHTILTLCNKYKETKNRFNIVRLGSMEKPFGKQNKDTIQRHEQRIKLLPGGESIKYKKAAKIISFISSDQADSLNGNIISIDNGESVKRLCT